MPDVQRHQEPPDGSVLRRLDGVHQVVDLLLLEAGQLGQLLRGDGVDVPRVLHPPQVDEEDSGLVSERLDVHGSAGGERGEPLDVLRRAAALVRTPPVGLLGLELDQGRAARVAFLGEPPGPRAWGTLGQDGADDLGDHVAGPADDDGVLLADVLPLHLLLVVQGGRGHGHPAHEDRLEEGEGGDDPRPAGVNVDLAEEGGAFLGGELVGDGPSRRVARCPQLFLQGDLIDLHHDPIDLVVDAVAMPLPLLAEGEDLFQRADAPDVRVDRKARRLQEVQDLGVAPEPPALHGADAVAPEPKRPGRGDARVLLPE